MATTEAQVTVTGTPENPVFNFVLPSGGKGEPGGLVLPVIAYSGDDANKYTTPGTVYQTSGSTLALNWPIAGKGHLLVIGAPGTVQQVFYPLIPVTTTAAKVSYTRVQLTATTWSPWTVFTSQRVDNTAGRAIYTWDDTANREQLLYGDTGWRDVKDDAGWKDSVLDAEGLVTLSANPFIRVRRTGTLVTVRLSFMKTGGANATAKQPFPLGFRLTNGMSGFFTTATNSSLSGNVRLWVGHAAAAMMYQVGGTTSEYSAILQYHTDDPWPTTLPGVAVGTIPNL